MCRVWVSAGLRPLFAALLGGKPRFRGGLLTEQGGYAPADWAAARDWWVQARAAAMDCWDVPVALWPDLRDLVASHGGRWREDGEA